MVNRLMVRSHWLEDWLCTWYNVKDWLRLTKIMYLECWYNIQQYAEDLNSDFPLKNIKKQTMLVCYKTLS